MKIIFTGGGSGGHFHPIIAVAEQVKHLVEKRRLVNVKLYYLSTAPYDEDVLFEHNIEFRQVQAGKWRRYFSLKNFFDIFKTAIGIIKAIWQVYLIYPDVIFSKGGYASFPVVVAAKFLKIPLIIHESDSTPGRANLWATKFASRIAVSYPEAVNYFPNDKTAVTGNPIREELLTPLKNGAREFLKLDAERPVVFVTGGSQGATTLNDVVIDVLPRLVEKYAVIHQVGSANLAETRARVGVVLAKNPNAKHYQIFDYLDPTAIRMVAGVASVIVSRAGSFVFEIAGWGIPSILVPIPESISHDQRTNAFTYARSGGAIVIEQENLTPSVLAGEIDRLISDPKILERMSEGAKTFARPDAAKTIAEELVRSALEHDA